MRFVYIFGLVFLLLISNIYAYDVNETLTINAEYREDGVLKASTGYITIYNPLGDVVVLDQSMTNAGIGLFNYSFLLPEPEGQYRAVVEFFSGTTYKGMSEQTFNVGNENRLKWGVCPTTGTGNTILIVIMVIMILLGIVGLVINHVGLTVGMAVLLLFLSAISWSCGWIIGTLNLIIGIIFLISGASMRF